MSTVASMKAAYRGAMDRFAALDTTGFLEACLELGWSEAGLPPETTLADALLELSRDGSIDAAAALNVLAISAPELEDNASAAIMAVFARNPAVREELLFDELVRLVDEEAEKMGMVADVDPTTGEKRWRKP